MGISPERFERMTWREFELNVRGYFLRLARQKWMFRELIWNLWACNATSPNFNLDRKEIMLLPWDEADPPLKEYTPEEIEEIRRRFEKVEIFN